MKRKNTLSIPKRFCWTKIGTESGESITSILARKELERRTNGGLFVWGIGNSVGAAIHLLVRRETEPLAVFSPMRSRPKSIDVSPAGLVYWCHARSFDGREWQIPRGSLIVSRSASASGKAKRSHYALVCRSDASLDQLRAPGEIDAGALVNLSSGTPLGPSQVTSVVERPHRHRPTGPLYGIKLVARLAYPYFIELRDPRPLADLDRSDSSKRTYQPELFDN